MGTIGLRVRHLRNRKGWNAAQLGEELTKEGVPWDRFTVRALEAGKRQNVTIQEFLALAVVLDVAPVHLLVPDGNETYRITPTREESSADVRGWVRGFALLEGTDPRAFWSEVPAVEFSAGWDSPGYRSWVDQVIRYLTRSMGRLYRRDDGTGVFEVDLPRAGEDAPPRPPKGGTDAGR